MLYNINIKSGEGRIDIIILNLDDYIINKAMYCNRCRRQIPDNSVRCPFCGNAVMPVGAGSYNNRMYAGFNNISLGDLFSGVFKKHEKSAGEKLFMSGTDFTTPTPEQMLGEWQRPWLFFRILILSIVFIVLCYTMVFVFGHSAGNYLVWFVGSLLIPLSVLTFFWEINIPRDIPLYTIMMIFLIGGLMSILCTLFWGTVFPILNRYAFLAPLLEEPAKLLVSVIFISHLKTKYGFGGLLIGAAVGAGFAAFENIYYIVDFGLLGQSLQVDYVHDTALVMTDISAANQIFFQRNIVIAGTHIAWAAMEGGAYALAKSNVGANNFSFPHFAGFLFIAMFLHFAWNGGCVFFIPSIFAASLQKLLHTGLVVVALVAVFAVISFCLKQVNTAAYDAIRIREQSRMQSMSEKYSIAAAGGPYNGAVFSLDNIITVGRDPALCNIVFPSYCNHVSRRHCSIKCLFGKLYVFDHNSTAGTFLINGQRIQPGMWVEVNMPFYIASPEYKFLLQKQAVQV